MVEARGDTPGGIPIPEIIWNEATTGSFTRSYDKRRDILFIHATPKRPAVSFDVGGHLWLRFDPETHEVVGVEIEDFEKVFLVKFPELRAGWERDKPSQIKLFRRDESSLAEYLRFLLLHIQNLLKNHPHQRELPLA